MDAILNQAMHFVAFGDDKTIGSIIKYKTEGWKIL